MMSSMCVCNCRAPVATDICYVSPVDTVGVILVRDSSGADGGGEVPIQWKAIFEDKSKTIFLDGTLLKEQQCIDCRRLI